MNSSTIRNAAFSAVCILACLVGAIIPAAAYGVSGSALDVLPSPIASPVSSLSDSWTIAGALNIVRAHDTDSEYRIAFLGGTGLAGMTSLGQGVSQAGRKLVLSNGQVVGLGEIPNEAAIRARYPRAALFASKGSKSAFDLGALMPPVGNQGLQDSCVAWAMGYYYKTYQEANEHGWRVADPTLASTDHQFSPAFLYNQINGGVDGGITYSGAMQLMVDKGAATLTEMPYNAADFTSWPGGGGMRPGGPPSPVPASVWKSAIPYRAESFSWSPTDTDTDLAALKAQLDAGHPFVIGFDIMDDLDASIVADDFYEIPLTSASLVGGHAVCVVGYDDDFDRFDADDSDGDGDIDANDVDIFGGFKIINSWGPTWAGDGFAYLSYEFFKRPRSDSGGVGDAYFMIDKIGYAPTAWAEVKIRCESRNDMRVTLRTLDGSASAVVFDQQGSDHMMDIHAWLDLTDAVASLPATALNQWELLVEDFEFKHDGDIKKFTIEYPAATTLESVDTTGPLQVYIEDLSFATARVPGPGSNVPTLTDGSHTPLEGLQADDFTFGVTYTDLDNDPPTDGRLQLLIENTTALTPLQAFDMVVDTSHANPLLYDGDYTNGEAYTVTMPGISAILLDDEIGDGHHQYHFLADDGSTSVRLPASSEQDGPLVNDPPQAPLTGFDPQSPAYPASQDTADIAVIHTASPTVSWDDGTDLNATDPAGTLHYVLQLAQNETFSPIAFEYTTADGATSFAVPPAAPLSEGIWYYRLQTVDDDDEPSAAWSYAGGVPYDAVTVFAVDLNQPPYWDAGTLTAADFTPTGDIRTLLTLFDWPDGSDDDLTDSVSSLRYQFQLDNDSDFSSTLIDVVTAPGVTEYQLVAGQELQRNVTYYWRVLVMDDQDLMSDWCDVELSISPPLSLTTNINSSLVNGMSTPLTGTLTTGFFFMVEYWDQDDLPPSGAVQVDIGGGAQVVDLIRDPSDTDAWSAGVTYYGIVAGSTIGHGTWTHHFQIAGTGLRDPAIPGSYAGPVIGADSQLRLTDGMWADTTTYEENGAIYVEVTDLDENADAAARDTVTVVISEGNGPDSETVTLDELGLDSGVFRGSIPSNGGPPGAVNDGVLDAASGPTGNTITAAYSDPQGGDNSQDTAVLGDRVAPAAVGITQLIATSGPLGQSVALDWTAYGEAGQLDVAGYNIYQSSAPFTDTTGMTPIMTTAAGIKTATVSGLTVETSYHFAVGPFDSVPNERTTVVSRWVKTTDNIGLYLANQNPAVGQVQVPLDTNIALDVRDDGAGVDIATVKIVVNGKWVTNKATLTDTGGGTVHIAYDPTADFGYNETVNVRIIAEDIAGNTLDQTYQFSTVTDLAPPQIANQVFDSSGGWFSFDLTDNLSGVATPTIVVTVDGTDVTASCVIDATDPLNVSVRYDAPTGWARNTVVNITVDASDVAGNAMAQVVWQGAALTDNAAPIIDSFAPTDGQQNVPRDTTISARVTDGGSGVDVASVTMTVSTGGTAVAGALVKGQAQVNPVFTPTANLAWGATYDVHVEATDDIGNTATADWSFSTPMAPTFDITGNVTDLIGDPMAGVQITAGSLAAITDGTGGYRLTGFAPGTYVVRAQQTGYNFTPLTQQVTVGPSAQQVDFVGRQLTWDVSGTVKRGGVGVIGVQVAVGGKTAVTDANGDYTISALTNGNYTATCSRDVAPSDGFEDFRYTPRSRAVSVQDTDVAGVDFDATPVTYTISGVVTDSSGNRIPGVTVGDGTRTAVTNEAGRYTIAGVPASTVVVTPTGTGYAFSPASAQVLVPPDLTNVDFTAYVEFTHRFPSGQNMIALPLTPPPGSGRLVDIFGTTQVARYLPANTPAGYVSGAVDPDHVELQAQPGKGYFVNLPAARTIAIPGDPVAAGGSFSVALAAGWNQVGNMYQTALPLANMNAAGGELRPFAFIYDNAIGNYRLISRDPSLNSARNYIEAWESAWFRAVGSGVSILVTAPAGVAAADLVVGPAAAQEISDGGWTIPIVAKIAGSVDMTTLAGVGNGSVAAGYRVENPPKAPGSVDVYFTDGAGGRLAHDVRPLGAANTTWDFAVETDVASASVELTLPDLSGVPSDQVVYLTDVDTGRKMYARTLPSYGFEVGESGAPRHFQLSVEDKGADHLMITSASAQSSANGAVVTYSVSTPCEVTVEVLNIAGRKVRGLTQARPAVAGVGTLSWNLRNDDGALAPAGQYLVTIEAISDNGQRVQALRPLHVTR